MTYTNHLIVITHLKVFRLSFSENRSTKNCSHNFNEFVSFFFVAILTDMHPTIISGLKNLRVLKTTRSSFVDFVNDEYRSLPDMQDRLFRYYLLLSNQIYYKVMTHRSFSNFVFLFFFTHSVLA